MNKIQIFTLFLIVGCLLFVQPTFAAPETPTEVETTAETAAAEESTETPEDSTIQINGVEFETSLLKSIMESIDINALINGEAEASAIDFSFLRSMKPEQVQALIGLFTDSQKNSSKAGEKGPESPTRAEYLGTADTQEVVVTSNDLNGAMEFVKIITADDQLFYLVIDYSSPEKNVYLLSTVTVNDLQYLAEHTIDKDGNRILHFELEDGNEKPTASASASTGTKQTETVPVAQTDKTASKGSFSNLMNNDTMMVVVLIVVIMVGSVVGVLLKNKGKKIDEDSENFNGSLNGIMAAGADEDEGYVFPNEDNTDTDENDF